MTISSTSTRRMLCSMACVSLGYVGPPSHTPDSPALLRITQDSIPLATITTDTGALAPGNKDFSRFSVPGMCLGAVTSASAVQRRSVAMQVATILHKNAVGGDTLPEGAMAIARACESRFTVERTAVNDLMDLFTLALMAGHDSVAHAVTARRLALAANAAARATVLQETVNGYLAAEPSRVAAAESTVAQMDVLGTQFQVARLKAHGALLDFARASFDEPYMQREAQQIVTLGHDGPTSAIQYDYLPIICAYMALSEIAYVESPDSVMAIIARAKQDLSRFRPGNEFPPGKPIGNLQNIDFRTVSLNTLRSDLLPFNAEQYKLGSIPPIQAAYWFPTAPGTWPPGDGHPSLILYGGMLANHCMRYDNNILNGPLGLTTCSNLYTYVSRWAKRYGNRLSVTIVSQTHGTAVRSGFGLQPTEEADSISWFFRDHLKLPITVGVTVDSVWQLKAIDGRKFYLDTNFYAKLHDKQVTYNNADSRPVVLFYGERGTLRYLGDMTEAMNLKVLDRLIERTMGVMPLSVLSH